MLFSGNFDLCWTGSTILTLSKCIKQYNPMHWNAMRIGTEVFSINFDLYETALTIFTLVKNVSNIFCISFPQILCRYVYKTFLHLESHNLFLFLCLKCFI